MNRCVGPGFRETVGLALEIVPVPIRIQLGDVHFFCGADPIAAGLHTYEDTQDDPRSYRNTMHCAYDFHLWNRPVNDRPPTTIIIPIVEEPAYIVHELGHALDRATGFEIDTTPVSWYAKTNRREAFAEAFAAWLVPGYSETRVDQRTVHFFESLRRRTR